MVLDADGVVVVDKPASLPSTGRHAGDPDCVQHMLAAQLGRAVWAVHQLDAGTTGLNVFVMRKSLVPVWQARLAYPAAQKTYVAVSHGRPAFDETVIDAPIGWSARLRRSAVVPGGRPAVSAARVLARTASHGLLEVEIRTGRTHQVRIHLAHVEHPLVGETRYRRPPCTGFERPALHAARIDFADGTPPFVAPVPADLLELIDRLGLRRQRIGENLPARLAPVT